MNIKINGETEAVAQPSASVAELLAIKKVDGPEMVSVQLNGEFLDWEE